MIGQLRKLLAIPGMGLLHVALVCVLCLASARAADGPELYLSLQGVADETVAQGEPLRVAVLIETGAESTWLLAPASGTWADAVAVEILAADSDTAKARAQAAGQPDEATATVDGERVAGGLWRFPADAVQALPPGAYRLRAALAISDGPGWHGTAASDELPLTVLPPSDDPARVALKTLALAQDALLSGDPQAAAKILDEELGRDPAQFRPLLLRAIIAEQAGNPLAAQWLLNLAELGNPVEPGSYPNVDFEETRARVLAMLLNPAPGSPLPEPPAWSWPPASVLDALRELMPGDGPAEAAVEGEMGEAVAEPASAETPVPGQAVAAEPAAQAALPATASDPVAPAAAPVVSGGGDGGPRYWLGDQPPAGDANGQWAASARAGSQYGAAERSAARAAGPPDVPGTDDHPNAWCPATRDSGSDWLELTFANAAPATEVRVRQNYGPGAIVRVEAIEPGGQAHTWWEGVDPYGQDGFANDAVWFSVSVPPTTYDVQKIHLTLDLGAHGRWKQIDAVQLIGVTAD